VDGAVIRRKSSRISTPSRESAGNHGHGPLRPMARVIFAGETAIPSEPMGSVVGPMHNSGNRVLAS
jgi:hypothetical protein